jgi:hypothetical protein
MQIANHVRPPGNFNSPYYSYKPWVMAFLFRKVSYGVGESQGLLETGKPEHPAQLLNSVLANNLPLGRLGV